MPIKGLTDRDSSFPRIGVLRKGAVKEGNRPGQDLKYFRFDTQDASAARAFREVYGDEPNNIRVYLPHPTTAQNFQTWKEQWAASSLIRRCDGCAIQMQRDGTGYTRKPEPCIAPKCECEPVGRLAVIVPELNRLAYVEAQTTSVNDILELSRNLEAIEGLRGDLRGIPFILSRRPRMISTPGENDKRVRREKWLLSIEAAPDWVALQLTVMQREALPSASPLELSAPMDDDEDDAPQIVELSAEASQPPNLKAEIVRLGKRAGELIAKAPAEQAALLSSAQAFAREVLRKNGEATGEEISSAMLTLNNAIEAAELKEAAG